MQLHRKKWPRWVYCIPRRTTILHIIENSPADIQAMRAKEFENAFRAGITAFRQTPRVNLTEAAISRITGNQGWLGSRVVSVLDSGAEGPGFRQTVHTNRAYVHRAPKLVAAILRVARVTAGLAESNGSLLPGL